ncbi:hypothetical protein M9H77_35798 [Catharanthus roseus]|uniref:Uncharacterized protein n=1 Tax=Catharanthus roseus TaxID=4058 RepID=A0ACB9ZRX4_CATRO|nr:hypothetical protein M9H77_35798 [Catharanthus roseus]
MRLRMQKPTLFLRIRVVCLALCTILAEYVWQQKSRFSGANMVELGAGTSLPGLVAAKLGANVTLIDYLNRPGFGGVLQEVFILTPKRGRTILYLKK